MIKSVDWIVEQAKASKLLDPFCLESVDDVVSYGLQDGGYTLRLANEWRVIRRDKRNKIFDPKECDNTIFKDVRFDFIDVFPGSFILAHSIENITMPSDVFGLVCGKSIYSRFGLQILTSIIEPGFSGVFTFGLSNASPLIVRLYAGSGIVHVTFVERGK